MSEAMSESHFYMWRALINLIETDGVRHPDEISHVREYIERLPASSEQRQTLLADVGSPMNFTEAYQKISEPRHRSQLVYHARILFWSDGDFAAQEEAFLNKLSAEVRGRVDVAAAMKEVEKVTRDFQSKQAQETSAKPMTRKFIDALMFWDKAD